MERQKETIARKGAVIDVLYTVINWHQEDCHRLRSALAQDLANKIGKFELHKTALVVANSSYNKLKDATPIYLQQLQGLEAKHKKLNEVHELRVNDAKSLKASLEQSARAMIAHDYNINQLDLELKLRERYKIMERIGDDFVDRIDDVLFEIAPPKSINSPPKFINQMD